MCPLLHELGVAHMIEHLLYVRGVQGSNPGASIRISCILFALCQRWASTLANRSNARHRSNIRAPPRPLPPDVSIQSVGICVARGAASDS